MPSLKRLISHLGIALIFGAALKGQTYTPYHFQKLSRPALDSLLANSTGLGIDAADNLYAATANSVIRLSSSGTLTTLAGVTGQSGFVDGTGPGARFLGIQYFTMDTNDDIYLIDQHAIRKITAQGIVTTLAGDPNSPGSNDGAGHAAQFNSPASLALDASGNVYVLDRGNYTVRKVTPTGVVTTLAGSAGVRGSYNGVGPAARFQFQSSLMGISCDRTTGNLFVSDDGNLREIIPDGTVITMSVLLGRSGALAVDASGNLISPTTYAQRVNVVSGNPYIDTEQVCRISPSGVVTLLGGDFSSDSQLTGLVDGYGAVAHFPSLPSALAMAADGRILLRYPSSSSGDVISVATAPSAPLPHHTPVIGTLNVSTPSNQAVTFTLPVSDPDGDPSYPNLLTYTITRIISGSGSGGGSNLFTFYPASGATGTGSVSFTVSDGYVTARGTVSITVTPAVTLLTNISTRGQVGTGDNVLIAGFVLGGSADTAKRVLIRAAGPALAAQNVSNPLNRPIITLRQGSTLLASNQGWGTTAANGASDIFAAGNTVGAFPFPDGSNDSALLASLKPGVYNATVSGVGGSTGISLVEVYDADVTNPVHHPVNVSTRGLVGTGENVLIAGVAVSGTTPQKFLIRAVGPGLSSVSNLGGLLADPQFHLYHGPTVLTQVTDWTNDAEMQTAVTQTGAFPLPAGSNDAAAIVTLDPGNYTVIVSGRSGDSGIALVEVYQLP